MSAHSIISLTLWILGLWLVVVVVHAVWLARDTKWSPLPAAPPGPHGEHAHDEGTPAAHHS